VNVLTSKRKKRAKPRRREAVSRSILQPGRKAPDFILNSSPDQKVSLHDFRGQPVILVFYPADWSPVCTDQLSLYNEIMSEFEKFNAKILAISVDSIWSHLAFAKDRKLVFPLLADFEPKGQVSQKYGVYNNRAGESARALFVIDTQGVIWWSYLGSDDVNPGADGILSALENLTHKAEA